MIYLVDNASKDGSVDILYKKYNTHPKVKLVLNQENLGFTRGNNRIMQQILVAEDCPPYLVLLNNDTVVEPDWLEKLLQSAIEHRADVVSCKMIDYFHRDRMDNAGHFMLNTGEILPIGHSESVLNYEKGFENMGACGGAAMYSTSMLKHIGIFDEYFNTGYEDAELGLRATISGYKCWYEPRAIVYHKMGQSIKKIFDEDYAVKVQENILYTYGKLLPIQNILFNLPFLLIRYAAFFCLNLLFLKKTHLNILYKSLKKTFQSISTIRRARRSFYKKTKEQTISVISLQKRLRFFLLFDLSRFYRIFLQKQSSALDEYGQ